MATTVITLDQDFAISVDRDEDMYEIQLLDNYEGQNDRVLINLSQTALNALIRLTVAIGVRE